VPRIRDSTIVNGGSIEPTGLKPVNMYRSDDSIRESTSNGMFLGGNDILPLVRDF